MARKSKRLPDLGTSKKELTTTYNVGIYLRISVEERGSSTSSSIEYQKQLCLDYIKNKQDMLLYNSYIDDGETGTNFQREGFQKMMFDIYNGKINCIIVKDLSRFGREYIEAGDYIEKVFPLLGVRFIAINDGFDNMVSPLDISVPIKNVINALYAKDISKKIASAMRMKQIKGDFVGGFAPYGYVRSEEDKNKLVIDPEAAEVVKQIFDMRLKGFGAITICRKLFEMNIAPPSKYKYEKNILYNEKFESMKYWSENSITNILSNEVYIGNMVQGKRKSNFYDGMPAQAVDKKDWVVVENTHEAIISKEVFDAVQAMKGIRSNYGKKRALYRKLRDNTNVLGGKVVCGECNKKLRRVVRSQKNNKKLYSFVCPIKYKIPTECSFEGIEEELLKDIIFKSIKMQISSMVRIEETLKTAMDSPEVKKEAYALTNKISETLSNIAYIKEGRVRATMDFSRKLLNEEEYEAIRKQFDIELQGEIERLSLYEKDRNKFSKMLSVDKWVADLKKYANIKKLTTEMVDAFIDCIKLYDDKRIEIVWKCDERYEEYLRILNGGEKLAG